MLTFLMPRFRKTADAIELEPWYLFRGAAALRHWVVAWWGILIKQRMWFSPLFHIIFKEIY